MARVPVVLPDGSTGTVDETEAPTVVHEQGRVLSPEEHAAARKETTDRADMGTVGGAAGEYADSALAGFHASQRGILESVGVPLDRAITGVADYIGGDSARKSTAAALKGLDERHPYLTATTGLIGNVAGAVGAAAAFRVPGGIGAAPIAGARGVATRMAVGGVENVIQATTRDVNEAALGDKEVNGEMLVANMPKHFVVGGLLTGAFEGTAHVLGKGVAAASRRAVPALEEGASKAVGRELGLEGAEAVEAGARVRGLNKGEVPTSKQGLADILTGEQAAQRGAAAAESTATADALAGAQTTEAALLSARQEAARKAASGQAMRGVAQAEGEAGSSIWDAAAGADAKLEEATAAGGARNAEARAAHASAGEEALAAGERVFAAEGAKETGVAAAIANANRKVAQVTEQFGAVHETLQSERKSALEALEAITAEHDATSKDLAKAIARIGDGTAGAQSVPRRVNGVPSGAKMQYAQRPPRVGDLDVESGELWTKESLARVAEERAASTGSEAIVNEAGRLTALQKSLGAARDHAKTHLAAVEDAIAENGVIARRGIKVATAEANQEAARASSLLTPPIENASKRSGHAMRAVEEAEKRVKQVEEETAAFIEKARGEGAGAVAKAEKRGAARVASAKADAEAALAKVEEGAKKEKAELGKTHEAQTKKLPEPSTETNVDALIKGMTDRAAAPKPLVSNGAMWGAGMSLLHGNPVAAATALGSSFAAGQARNHGNLLMARTMRGLSTTLSSVDAAIQAGAASILTGTAGRAVKAAGVEDIPTKHKEPSFEDLSKNLIDLQANPMELEHRVRSAVGHVADAAPGTYQEILATTQRAHQFLLSILPLPERDPNTLTPHLMPGDVGAIAKYEFMQSARTIDDPFSVFADVKDGSITQSQVDAIQAVYPRLYDMMRAETKRQSMYLTTPVDYERELHVGVLLGQVTNQVLEPDFQALMRTSYADKSKKAESVNASGSGASGSKMAKNMMSGSESIEGGTP